jgi:hypothetical protein
LYFRRKIRNWFRFCYLYCTVYVVKSKLQHIIDSAKMVRHITAPDILCSQIWTQILRCGVSTWKLENVFGILKINKAIRLSCLVTDDWVQRIRLRDALLKLVYRNSNFVRASNMKSTLLTTQPELEKLRKHVKGHLFTANKNYWSQDSRKIFIFYMILLRDIQLTHVQRSEVQLWKRCFLTKIFILNEANTLVALPNAWRRSVRALS